MAFIEYTGTKGGLRPGSAKLTKTHLILSPDMQDKIETPNVQVAYDPDNEQIRLRPVGSGGLKITDGKVQSKGFAGYFGINKRGIFNAEWNEDEKAIFISLNNTSS